MSEQEVVNLMKSSRSEHEWNKNCDKVKAECGGYPSFWYAAIILSGIAAETSSKWGGSADIKIVPL